MDKIPTICPYCGCGCGLYLHVDGGNITGVSPVRNHPVNKGSLCVKGWNSFEFVQHPERLKKPLIRISSKEDTGKQRYGDTEKNVTHSPIHPLTYSPIFREASWEEAINLVAGKLSEIKKLYGPDSIGILSSAKCTNEENFVLMKFARAVLGTNNVDHCARL